MSIRFPARLDVDRFATVNRRLLLQSLGASALVTATGGLFARPVWGSPVFAAYPFSLGVASGDPAPDGFVIWTKIAPKPLERGGGMPKRPVEVEWSVAADERMRQVVRKGTAIAHPELGHAVHVEVDGLEPARDYFYQFTIGKERSRVGRARTLPPAGAPVAQVRFGVAGCQKYEDGYFTAYPQHRGRAVRFRLPLRRLHLRISRAAAGPSQSARRPRHAGRAGRNATPSTTTGIATAFISPIPDLQAAHASAPFIMSFDDHEVDNDWAGDTTEEYAPPELFLLRRAAAFQAWYEHLPVRKAQMPRGPDILAYRRFGVGDLLVDERARHAQLPLAASLRQGPARRWPIAPKRTSRTAPCSARRRSDGSTTASRPPRRAGPCSPSRSR